MWDEVASGRSVVPSILNAWGYPSPQLGPWQQTWSGVKHCPSMYYPTFSSNPSGSSQNWTLIHSDMHWSSVSLLSYTPETWTKPFWQGWRIFSNGRWNKSESEPLLPSHPCGLPEVESKSNVSEKKDKGYIRAMQEEPLCREGTAISLSCSSSASAWMKFSPCSHSPFCVNVWKPSGSEGQYRDEKKSNISNPSFIFPSVHKD